MKRLLHFAVITLFLLSSCSLEPSQTKSDLGHVEKTTPNLSAKQAADAKTILARREVPVLCYHQIRNNLASDSKRAHDDIISPDKFRDHIKMLADSGYHTILPDQLYDYLVFGSKLPNKPIMITFDDTDEDQFTVGNATLKKYGFKGVYFIMTVSIGRKGRINYMTKAQIKQLADEGNIIASHTYDHKNFTQFTDADWTTQIDEPTKKLEEITGKKVAYFAYPYGVYKASTLHKLKEHGFKAAFILSTPRDEQYPLYTIRRIIDPGRYTAKNLYYSINKSFNKTKS
ncbi:polysaccharide deacetylase family protein [Pedobacter sandarakinus]|uniref:polysaccharide deacetylase family protein n=1 Tax=Pedobacter sandarakinus TaxID=353156 RepID=UPI0022450295|nr:polysaccharide deacetylase family protein [Pedobacter sandarakinus]MCX2575219.1 polysaccharide deacetylase family protein [Pedobacter sandarakinus]